VAVRGKLKRKESKNARVDIPGYHDMGKIFLGTKLDLGLGVRKLGKLAL
jgi:hypothetical protein